MLYLGITLEINFKEFMAKCIYLLNIHKGNNV